jgi:methylated-DNA-[protein]-cysteine S-methyltransferase
MNASISEQDLRRAFRGGPEDAGDRGLGERLAARAAEEGLLDVVYAIVESPLGEVVVAATPRGLIRIALPNERAETVLEQLSEDVSPRVLEAPARLDDARRELDEYFAGSRRDFDLDLDWSLSRAGFYRRVLRELLRVPFGQTVTYGEMAARAGSPRAHRAAGSALGSNPIPIVVPCHRIVRAGGDIGNYGGGPEMKRFLLHHEGAI